MRQLFPYTALRCSHQSPTGDTHAGMEPDPDVSALALEPQESTSSLPLELLSVIVASAIGSRSRLLSRALRHEHDTSQVSLAFSPNVPSSATVLAIAKSRPQVRSLSLRGCAAVDDDALTKLLAAMRLSNVDVSGCPRLTARSLTALHEFARDHGGTWASAGTFWSPSPLMTARMIVVNQVLALRRNDDEGMRRCFGLASPANREVTGPLPRFAHMIRRSFSIMLNASAIYVGVEAVAKPADVTWTRIPVVYEGPTLQKPLLLVWMLERVVPAKDDEGADEGVGSDGGDGAQEAAWCWMTAGVGDVRELPHDQLDNLVQQGRLQSLAQYFSP